MRKNIHKIGIFGASLAFMAISGSTVLALPPQASVHAQSSVNAASTEGSGSSNANTQGSANAAAGQTNGQSHMQAGQLKACQNRQTAINNILSRIVTRGQNQLTLFNTIAQRVESFKTTKNLTVSNYSQLLVTLQTDQTKATNDLGTMKSNDTFDCSSPNPKAMVTAFQADLKTEISDLQTYRTDVKNLIVAVKTAASTSSTGSTTTNTSSSTTTGGN